MSQPGKPVRMMSQAKTINKSIPLRKVKKQSTEKYKNGYWMTTPNSTGDTKSIAVQIEKRMENSNDKK